MRKFHWPQISNQPHRYSWKHVISIYECEGLWQPLFETWSLNTDWTWILLFIFVVWNKPDSMALMSLHDLIVLLLRGWGGLCQIFWLGSEAGVFSQGHRENLPPPNSFKLLVESSILDGELRAPLLAACDHYQLLLGNSRFLPPWPFLSEG